MARATEPSVIVFRDGDWSETEIVERMEELLTALSEKDIQQSILVIESSRIRRRRLPVK